MGNELILAPELAGLPADLRAWATGLLGLADAASGGISKGGHPRLSIKNREFTALDLDSNEQRVGGFSNEVGRFVDVIVVGANPSVSKLYYSKPFDPATTEPVAPDCYSDNGIGPSISAETPQCSSCAACPHNAWGSKTTPGGASIKACSDAKKIAVLLTEDLQGPVYELRIPAASMKGFAAFAGSLKGRGVPLPMVVLGVGFDSTVTYPKLTFRPSRYVEGKAELPVVQNALATKGDEIADAVGSRDTPTQAPVAQPVSNVVQMPQPTQAPAPEAPKKRSPRAAAPADPLAGGFGQGAVQQSQNVAQQVSPQAAQRFDDAPQTGAGPSMVPSDAALDGLLSGIEFN